MDCVKNDRTKLAENARSKVLIEWVRIKMDEVAAEILSKEKKEQEADQKKISAAFNDYLNKWKDRFMNKIMGNLTQGGNFGDGDDDSGGGRKILEVPENGFAFSFPMAEISKGEEKKITLKASVPEPIPVGSIVSFASDNPKIKVADGELKITSDGLRIAEG